VLLLVGGDQASPHPEDIRELVAYSFDAEA